ncbi:MAG: translation elongation factor Ts [Bacteroides sp.]|nr:MAG: translation elongation factor Ts [Bacteroides sp.]
MIKNNIKLSDIIYLRKKTNVGILDCKNALIHSNGDIDKSLIYLRKVGAKILSNRDINNLNEGIVIIKNDDVNKKSVILTLKCETDFVAQNNKFINLAYDIANIAVSNKIIEIKDLLKMTLNDISVYDMILDCISSLGEKIVLHNYNFIDSDNTSYYMHNNKQIGVITLFNKKFTDIKKIGKYISMQIASMNPIAISIDDVTESILNTEIDIIKSQLSNKYPDNIKNKIITGKIEKFYREKILLEQSFIKDNKITIKSLLQSIDKNLLIDKFYHHKIK